MFLGKYKYYVNNVNVMYMNKSKRYKFLRVKENMHRDLDQIRQKDESYDDVVKKLIVSYFSEGV